jgi:hypothetical protein
VGVVFALGVAGLAYWQRGIAVEQERLTLANETRALSALSRVALADHHPVDAVKLGLAAWPREEKAFHFRADLRAEQTSCSTRSVEN